MREEIGALEQSRALIKAELDMNLPLVKTGDVSRAEILKLERQGADIQGQITNRRNKYLQDIQTDLVKAQEDLAGVLQILAQRKEQLDYTEIRAPMDGVVHEMKIATLGGVVAPGATVLDIIPLGQGVSFEVRVDPRSIDQVHAGQEADLVLASFDPRSTPRLKARVLTVSPDAVVDAQSGRSFYRVDLAVPAAEIARLGDQGLMPGMPISAYLVTSSRSVLTYLLQPLTSQLDLAFRED